MFHVKHTKKRPANFLLCFSYKCYYLRIYHKGDLETNIKLFHVKHKTRHANFLISFSDKIIPEFNMKTTLKQKLNCFT